MQKRGVSESIGVRPYVEIAGERTYGGVCSPDDMASPSI